MRRILAPVRCWIWLYTLGLPPIIREERRAELESDLWEEWRHGAGSGLDAVARTRSVWTRWLLGIPDDLAWRADLMAMRSMPAGTSRGRLARLSAGIVVAIVMVLVAVTINTVLYIEGTQPSGDTASILLLLAIGTAVVGTVVAARGFRVMGARQEEGALLVVGGSTVAGLAWYWLFLPVAAAIVVSAYGVWRAVGRRDGRRPPGGSKDAAHGIAGATGRQTARLPWRRSDRQPDATPVGRRARAD